MRRAATAVALLALAILVSAWTQSAIYDVTPQYGRVAAAGVTGSTAGGANTVLTLSGKRRVIVCTNSLNTENVLTYDGSNWIALPASTGVAIDLGASGLNFVSGKVVGVYYLSAPASGAISCTAL